MIWRLTAGLCVVCALITCGVIRWRTHLPADSTTCIQIASATPRQVVYPTLIDTNWNTSVGLPNRPAPETVITVAENSQYRVQQAYHFQRIFSMPYRTSVENIATGIRVDLPSVVSNNSIIWSHDRIHLAYYMLTRDEVYTLILANADGSGSKVFPLPAFNQIATFSWSSDDQYVIIGDYFYTRLIHVADGQMVDLADHNGYEEVSTFTWSPRGHQLAYLWSKEQIPNHVVIYDPDTRSQHKYVRPDAKYWWDGRLLWSPDQRYVAAIGWTDTHLDIVGMDGSGVVLYGGGWDSKSLAATWLPATNQFVFMNDANDLIMYDVTTSRYQRLVANLADAHIELLADQHRLIFMQRQPDQTVALVSLDLSSHIFTPLVTATPSGWVSSFNLLADRTTLVVSVRENDAFTAWLLNTATNERHQLATGLSNFYVSRSWSDPSTFMYFWSVGVDSFQFTRAGWDVYDLAGNRQAQFQAEMAVFPSGYDSQYFIPFWSPDRRYAIFVYADPDLYKGALVMSSDGKHAWRLDQNVWGLAYEHMLWSPDSSKVALTVNIAGRATVLVYTAEGKLLTRADNSLLPEYLRWTTCQP